MHWFLDEWSIDSNVYTLDERVLFNYIKIKKLQANDISFSDIAYRTDVDRDFYRYQLANIKYPMIVSQIKNPYDKLYRLLDGKHRIHKLLEQGYSSGLFYDIPREFVLKNLQRYR